MFLRWKWVLFAIHLLSCAPLLVGEKAGDSTMVCLSIYPTCLDVL